MKRESLPGGVRVGNLFFSSGMTGRPGDVKTQVKNTLEKLKKALEAAGSSMDNVVKATVYLTDIRDRETALNPLWKEYFPKNPPARTCVQISNLSQGTFVEIELVALIP